MKLAYTSDLHADFFMRDAKASKLLIEKAYGHYFKDLDSEYLIVAGDISHYPEQSAELLINLKEVYGLKEIFVVLGNHELYLVNDKQRKMFPTGLHKMAYQQDLFALNGIQVLDGTTYELPNGIVIGGANSFYDGTIYYRMTAGYYKSDGGLQAYWKRTMSDSKYSGLDDFWEYAKSEKDKLSLLKNSVDIMVTHVKPLVDNKYFHPMYQNDMVNAFYSFDFEEEIATDTRLQTWIYGHTHMVESFEFLDVDLLANPFGYPSEIRGKTIKHFEVTI
jgi:predicted MPP superfamily phosphohydrolase